MAGEVVHFEVVGRDGASLQKFYGELFDWDVRADNPMNYGMVSAPEGGPGIGGGISAGPDGSSYVTFYVQVDDVAAALERAEQLGGRKLMDPMEVPDGPMIAQFEDPEGNRIGLVKG